ncbi:MAG TPA: hypothetical protein VFZ13_13925 [Gemmatimonadales bacterium]
MRAPVLIPLLVLGPALLEAQAESSAALASRITAAAALPALAEEIRGSGVSRSELTSLLDVFRTKNIPAPDAKVILEEERSAARDHGPVPGLGSFVQARLDEGLRGRELAAAIRAEHAARGIGGDGMSGNARGKSAERGNASGRGNRDDQAPARRDDERTTPESRADDRKTSDTASRKPSEPGNRKADDAGNRKVEAPR